MRLPLPEDPARRAFTIAVVCSILLHILLLASFVWVNTLGVPAYARRGEPLIVDIAPDKPEEKTPLGNPAVPPGSPPPAPSRKAAEPPAAKPSIPAAPPPKPAAPAKAPPPRPEPPKQVAKVAPPLPEPQARATTPPPSPSPALPPPAPVPEPSPQPREALPGPASEPAAATKPQPAAPPPSPGSEKAGGQTALAKPAPEAPSIFRNPGGGGGLSGGRGGSVGEPIPLDTPDPNYREYMEKVRKRIYANWGYPYEAQQRELQGKLVIEFHIAKDGHLQFIELRETSGEDVLDSYAMRAVKLAQMYPPLPDAMRRDVLPVVGTFVYILKGPLSVLQALH